MSSQVTTKRSFSGPLGKKSSMREMAGELSKARANLSAICPSSKYSNSSKLPKSSGRDMCQLPVQLQVLQRSNLDSKASSGEVQAESGFGRADPVARSGFAGKVGKRTAENDRWIFRVSEKRTAGPIGSAVPLDGCGRKSTYHMITAGMQDH